MCKCKMTGVDLKAMRLSLGLTVAQAAMICEVDSADYRNFEFGHHATDGYHDALIRANIFSGLQRWQAAGERKDEQ